MPESVYTPEGYLGEKAFKPDYPALNHDTGALPEVDIDSRFGGDLRTEAIAMEQVPQDINDAEELVEALVVGGETEIAAMVSEVNEIMHEYLESGEPFLIREDAELRKGLIDHLTSSFDVSSVDIDRYIKSLQGFPPVKHLQDEYVLAS